jgi:hypothetical protein
MKLWFWSKAQSSILNKAVHVKQWSAAAMTGTFHTIHSTYQILHWTALQFCRENNKWIVRKAVGRLEHPFLMLGEQQNEALQDQRSQLNHCPCPRCYINLLNLFFKARQISTNPGHQLLQPAHPCEGGLKLLTHLLGLAPPPSKPSSWPVDLATTSSSWVILPTAPIVWRLR